MLSAVDGKDAAVCRGLRSKRLSEKMKEVGADSTYGRSHDSRRGKKRGGGPESNSIVCFHLLR